MNPYRIILYLTIYVPVGVIVLWFLIRLIQFLLSFGKSEELHRKRKEQLITSVMVIGMILVIAVIIILIISHLSTQSTAGILE